MNYIYDANSSQVYRIRNAELYKVISNPRSFSTAKRELSKVRQPTATLCLTRWSHNRLNGNRLTTSLAEADAVQGNRAYEMERPWIGTEATPLEELCLTELCSDHQSLSPANTVVATLEPNRQRTSKALKPETHRTLSHELSLVWICSGMLSWSFNYTISNLGLQNVQVSFTSYVCTTMCHTQHGWIVWQVECLIKYSSFTFTWKPMNQLFRTERKPRT